THSEGGFYSAEDADSEGEEGKFYLWDVDELRSVLDKKESDFAIKVFNLADDGNWIDESKGMMPGTNILHLTKSNKELANEFNISEDSFSKMSESIRKKLFDYREKRVHPHKDDKILTDWNALMISAFAKAAQALGDNRYAEAAVNSYSFIEKYLIEKDGRLIHRFRDGESGLPAYIDDYAFMINALIDLYETTFDIKYLDRAIELNEILIKEFWDEQNSGFFFSSSTSEKLIARQKDVYDGAVPSGNSVALLNLIRLSRFTANNYFEEKASELTKYFSGYILRSPSAFSMFMCGLDFLFSSSTEIVILCEQKDDLVIDGINVIRRIFNPNKIVILILNNIDIDFKKLLSFTNDMKMKNNSTTFYVCRDFACNQPVNSIKELEKLLL
ncbi:MAG TPA: thioredoxin domain-containing protein, partial [Ignavibacteriaceae bacterium]